MNKKAKFMLVMLSAASVVAGAFGIAGCNSNKGGGDSTQVSAVYEEYVAYATANGQTVLTYEQWLETIKSSVTIKGDKGDTPSIGANGNWFIGGTDTGVKASGEDGQIPSIGANGNWFIGSTDTGVKAAGKNGEEGVGVEEIKMSEDGKSLVIKYTNGDTDVITLPEEITHVHKYDDDNVQVLLMPTDKADGLGYKKCEDDEHIELVVLKAYQVKLTLEGKPVEGVGVKINGKTAVSNTLGVARFADFGDYNDYLVVLDTDKYEVAGTLRTGNAYGADLEMQLTSKLAAGNVVPGSGSYAFNLQYDSWDDAYGLVSITLEGGENTARKYKLTSTDSAFSIKDDNNIYGNELVENGEFVAVVAPGERKTVYVTADIWAFEDPWSLPDSYSYMVKVEELVAPAIGTDAELPITANDGVVTELPADSQGWVYYCWTKSNSEINTVSFELTDAEAVFTTVVYDAGSWKYVSDDVEVTEDSKLAVGRNDYTYSFKVKATGDNPSFKLVLNAPLGSSINPVPVAINTEAEYDFNAADAIDGMSKWFKFTCPTDGGYFIQPTKTNQIYIYKGSAGGAAVDVIDSEKAIKLTAGDYYFQVEKQDADGVFQCGFKIRAFTDDDYGSSKEFAKPVTLDNNRATVTASKAGVETMYFEITATKDGLFRMSGASQYSAWINGISGFVTSKDVTEGEKIVIAVASGTTVNVAVLGEDELKEDHTFTVVNTVQVEETVDGELQLVTKKNPIAGAKVIIKNGEEKVAEGVTDDNGVVVLNYIPGNFDINVEKDGYYFDMTDDAHRLGTSASKLEYTLNLRNDVTHVDYTVKTADGTVFANATLTFKTTFNDKTILTVKTDENGQASVDFYLPANGDIQCSVTLDPETPDLDSYYMITSPYDLMYNSHSLPKADETITFGKLATFTVTVKNADGKGVKGVTVTLTPYMSMFGDYMAMQALGSAVTDANGVATLMCKPVDNSTNNKVLAVSFSTLPEGYSAPELDYFDVDLRAFEATLIGTATNPDPVDPVDPDPDNPDPEQPDVPVEPEKKPVNGQNSVNYAGNAVVGEGVTEIVNEGALGYYMFTATEAGVYSFVINDAANAGYVTLLSYGTGTNASRFTKLIDNGKEVSVACDLILGKNRGFNKVYEFTVKLGKGQAVAIGYNTGTEEGGSAYLSVTNTGKVETPENPDLASNVLTKGENTVTLVNGQATVTFEYTALEELYLDFDDESVTIYDQEDLDNNLPAGYGLIWGEDLTYTFVISVEDSSVTSVTITITDEAPNYGPGNW